MSCATRLILGLLCLIAQLDTACGQETFLKPIIAAALDSNSHYAIDFDSLKQDRSRLPIGVFDSGIGGLTVLEAILSLDVHNNSTLQPGADGVLDFHGENFIYLGDQANMPYGNYASVGKERFLRELIIKDAIFLLGKKYWKMQAAKTPSFDKLPVKAIAIGCNTATAFGLNDIREAIGIWGISVPVVGVVEAGAKGLLTHEGRDEFCVAVMATVGTCKTGVYPRTISSALGLAGRKVPEVIQQGFVELAAAIEGDQELLKTHSIGDLVRRDTKRLVEEYRNSGGTKPIRYVVLGCTHFPLISEEFLAAFDEVRRESIDGQLVYERLIAEQVSIINPAQLTAIELFRTLAKERIRTSAPAETIGNSRASLFISVPALGIDPKNLNPDGTFTSEYKFSRNVSDIGLEDTRIVPMHLESLSVSSRQLIETRLPHVWSNFPR